MMLQNKCPDIQYEEPDHISQRDSLLVSVIYRESTTNISNCPPSSIGDESKCWISLLSKGMQAKSIILSKKSKIRNIRETQYSSLSPIYPKKTNIVAKIEIPKVYTYINHPSGKVGIYFFIKGTLITLVEANNQQRPELRWFVTGFPSASILWEKKCTPSWITASRQRIMFNMSTWVKADNASWFFGSERRRASHLVKRVVSSVAEGVTNVSFSVRLENSVVRFSTENFSVSTVEATVDDGLDSEEPIPQEVEWWWVDIITICTTVAVVG